MLRFALVCPMLVLAMLSGCSALTMEPGASRPLFASPIMLDANRRMFVPRQRIDRYVCETGAPLMCTCVSRLSYDCECGC
jgi:hypothetical protein